MTTVGRDNRGMRKTNGGRKPRFSRGGSRVRPKRAVIRAIVFARSLGGARHPIKIVSRFTTRCRDRRESECYLRSDPGDEQLNNGRAGRTRAFEYARGLHATNSKNQLYRARVYRGSMRCAREQGTTRLDEYVRGTRANGVSSKSVLPVLVAASWPGFSRQP